MVSSKELRSQMTKSDFDSFRTKRKNALLKRGSYFERTLHDWIEVAFEKLKEHYRCKLIPQKSCFIKGYGLVYMDAMVKVVCRKEAFGVEYGAKFCIELDEPYHDSQRQKTLDSGREKAIRKKFCGITFVRIKLDEMQDQKTVLKKLLDAFDWFRPKEK